MFSLSSLGLPARGAGAARVGSGSSSPQGKLETHTHTHQTNERISRSDTYGAVENLKLELSKRLSHCRIWLCFTCMVKKNKMKLKVNYHGQFCCSFSVRCVASMLV